MMVATAHSDKSRDYTIPDSGVLSSPQPPAVPAAVASWQSAPQAPSMYGAPATSARQIPTWDPNMMGVQPDFSTVARAYTEQTYALSSLSPYPTSGRHHATTELLNQAVDLQLFGPLWVD
ncbi:uncharacterized protein LOC110024975 [Phalaenopsis equestris]|uniref:uncharacterized protein LOC110024975 n=1 Tax=Phalaenopsis equestris TaxID=78828 RepID=UPI0009E556D3|nr:uncharacterized protein LOC110024975 [Phalaenopsis equestris]